MHAIITKLLIIAHTLYCNVHGMVEEKGPVYLYLGDA